MTALRLGPRAGAALALACLVGLAAFVWPIADPAFLSSHSADAPWVFVVLLPLCLAVVFAELSDGGFDGKTVAVLGILAGIDAALRPLSGGGTGFTFVYLLLICGGRVFGPAFGFALGTLTLLASALLTAGVGPWLPFQMVAAGWVGLRGGAASRGCAGGPRWRCWRRTAWWRRSPTARCSTCRSGRSRATTRSRSRSCPHGSVATNLLHWWRFDVTTSLGFDVPAAVGNAVLLLALGRPVLAALRRVARRAAFDAPVSFAVPGGSAPPRSAER